MNKCIVNECERSAKALGYCSAHYERLKKGSGLNPAKPIRKSAVSVTDEELRDAVKLTKSWRGLLNYLGFATMSGARKAIQNRVKKLGLDISHYPIQNPRVKCLIEGCTELNHSKDYCLRHYGFLKRNGDPLKIIITGKRRYDAYGYIMLDRKDHPFVTSKTGRIFEHRLIMSEKLGRALLTDEQVHHKNSQRQDNRIDNLELWSTNQPIGGRVKDLIKWAKEILAIYGDDETKYG
ncbi:HNH endonuclease [Spirosoma linguale]